ncbi:MAG TPA: hypothetical protein VIV11_16120 [Kofleriaceae bacterium]
MVLLAGLVFGSACSGETGTLSVTLTSAPGSTLLDSVQTLRLTLTNPRRTETAERTASGFAIALELPATGEATQLLVEGLDAGGVLVANGASPPFPVGALDGRIIIYMAAPLSVGASPGAFAVARSEVAVAPLPYGAIFAGGRLDTGAPSDAVSVYNAFDHSVVSGMAMPAPRAGLALAAGNNSAAYMFGGSDEAGLPTATLWRFDTTAPPAGVYQDYGIKDGFERAGQLALPLGSDRFVLSGMPGAELAGLNGTLVAIDGVAALPSAGVSVVGNDGMVASIFAGPASVVQYRAGTVTELALPAAARADATVVALPGGKTVVVCGTTEAVRIDAATGNGESIPNVPTVAKTGCAATATARHLVIAGGTALGVVDPTVEIFDAASLALIATTQLGVPRTGAVAIALPNDQILIGGGVDAAGAPVGTLELFTPPVE